MQSDEFAVPIKRDVMVDNSLSKNLLDIFLKREKKDASATLHRIIWSTAMLLQRRIRESLKSQDHLLLLRGTVNLFVPRNPCRNATYTNIIFHLRLCTVTYEAMRFLISLDLILIRKRFLSCNINNRYFTFQHKINSVFLVPQGVELSLLSEVWIPKLQCNAIFVILSMVWLRHDYYIHTSLNMTIEDSYKKYYQQHIISSAVKHLIKTNSVKK